MTTHNHKLVFGRNEAGCPRCEELKNGAEPVKGWGWRKRESDARRTLEIRNHDCKKSGCGPVCTAFDW